MTRRRAALVLAVCLVATLSGCGGDDEDDGSSPTELTVFAASSLTGTFTELEKAFETDHEGVDVRLSFDSSSSLAQQIVEGAPADVLATADQASMQILVDADGNAGEPVPFASNTMAIVTPPGNPAGVEGLEDLVGTDFVLCDPSVPCGAAAQEVLGNAGVAVEAVSLEDKVTSVLSRVQLGEADAGIVYVTDAQAAGDAVETIAIPDDVNVVTAYYLAVTEDAPEPDLAAQWQALVSSQAGQRVLEAAGFGGP